MRCKVHSSGVSPGMRPFFVAGCEACEQKKAEGKLTGNEPPPLVRAYTAHRRLADWAMAASVRKGALRKAKGL